MTSLWLVLMTGIVQAAPPSLSRLSPAGGQRGNTVSVQCEGKFDWPISVFAPGVDVEVTEEPGKIKVTIPQDLSADRIWFRLFNAQGASGPVPFLIGNVRELSEEEPNNSPQQAQDIEDLPIIINGVLTSADVDTYSVNLDEGQTLVAAVDAHWRMGSPIDSIVQITSADGFVLAENNDYYGLDPATSFTAKKAETVLVRLFGFSSEPNQSIALQGCNDCHYRLTLTTGPCATHTIPLALSSTDETEVKFVGWNIPADLVATASRFGHPQQMDQFELEPPTDLRLVRDSWLGYADHNLLTSGRRFRYVSIPTRVFIDREFNDSPVAIDVPLSVTGRLNHNGQSDTYTVPLSAGDSLLLACEAQTLGLPTDPWVRLLDPSGAVVADVDDAAKTRDSFIRFTAKSDGTYTIIVMDRFRSGSHRHFYLLTATLEQPDFQLVAKQDQIVLSGQDPVELPIQVIRQGGSGTIRIFLEGLPEGIAAAPVESLAEGESSQSVTLRLVNKAAEFSGPVRVIGEMSQPRPIRRAASVPPQLETSFHTLWLTALPTADSNKTAAQ
jgi:hypothetical protein